MPQQHKLIKIFNLEFEIIIVTIKDLLKKYQGEIDRLDLEVLLAHSLGKTREFVLIYPEKELTSYQSSVISKLLKRRISGEPIAHLTKHKEFYGLDFIVNKHTLVPRPETEMLVENVLSHVISHQSLKKVSIIDIGTGSGCIITSIANTLENNKKQSTLDAKCIYCAIDISKEALKIAKKNATIHKVDKKIKFLPGNLLTPLIENYKLENKDSKIIIIANLPYLSKEIYESAPIDVKKYEPKSALYSPEQGLQHYRKLLLQIRENLASHSTLHISCFLEISPEQKQQITKVITTIFPLAQIEFKKDLAGKWRVCRIEIN